MLTLRKKLYKVIFEADTRAGKVFDEVLLGIILTSIAVVMAESIHPVREKYATILRIAEWIITGIFTLEYVARIWVTDKPIRYIFSFYGIIDLLSIIPTYLSFFLSGGQSLLVIRALRLLRVFRIFKLSRYSSAGRMLVVSMWKSKEKIGVFIMFVITITVIMGTIMYLIEGEEHGFDNIPISIYWAIVTITTVGYGDISPGTPAGQLLASMLMIIGYSIIAVPTGIVTANLLSRQSSNTQVCSRCLFEYHDDDAMYCKHCGASLDKSKSEGSKSTKKGHK